MSVLITDLRHIHTQTKKKKQKKKKNTHTHIFNCPVSACSFFSDFSVYFKQTKFILLRKIKQRTQNCQNHNHKEREKEKSSFKSNENIHKKEGGSYYVVSANKASSVTL